MTAEFPLLFDGITYKVKHDSVQGTKIVYKIYANNLYRGEIKVPIRYSVGKVIDCICHKLEQRKTYHKV